MPRQSIQDEIREEQNRLKDFTPLEHDPFEHKSGAVLLSDQIIYLAKNHKMIEPFDEKNLKPAGYELTIGDEFFMGRTFYKKGDRDFPNRLIIDPFEVAVIKTRETLCVPRFLIGRWNIRVKHAYRGLMWVGGPQVDAGYKGHLFCPLYNLADKPVALDFEEAIALIDFVKTSPYNIGESKAYPEEISRPTLRSFGIDNFGSGLVALSERRIKDIDDRVREVEREIKQFTTLIFTIIAILVASVAVIATYGAIQSPEVKPIYAPWIGVPSAASAFAVVISLAGLRSREHNRAPYFWPLWFLVAIILATVVFASAVIFLR